MAQSFVADIVLLGSRVSHPQFAGLCPVLVVRDPKPRWLAARSLCGTGGSSFSQTDAQTAKPLSYWCQHLHLGQRLHGHGLNHPPICHVNVPRQCEGHARSVAGNLSLPGPVLQINEWLQFMVFSFYFISLTLQHCVIYWIICNCM